MYQNNRRIGTGYETRAALFLEEAGCRILERNYRCRLGEIDLIAEQDGVLVFVEVKFREGSGAGDPLEAVGVRKQQTIYRVAQQYLLSHGLSEETPCRFDVIGMTRETVRHIENAFGGM
ncbi:MAG: YraN family protein [Lachnospiraceae bacterium]|nr:YraN family protein [Lachnospiraceae bacterium]